jgi:hypothetical protein
MWASTWNDSVQEEQDDGRLNAGKLENSGIDIMSNVARGTLLGCRLHSQQLALWRMLITSPLSTEVDSRSKTGQRARLRIIFIVQLLQAARKSSTPLIHNS